MERINRSPQITQSSYKSETMDFGSAMNEVLNGKKVRRQDWKDEGIYLTIKEDQLMIFKTEDKLLHPLTVSAGDIAGDDWVITEIQVVH